MIWIIIWLIGIIPTFLLVVFIIVSVDDETMLNYFHNKEYDESQFLLFLFCTMWPFFVPFGLVCAMFIQICEVLEGFEMNPIRWFCKKVTEKKYIRERVMEEI